MNPKRIKIEEKIVSGISVRTCNKSEMDQSTAKIQGLWNDFFQQDIFEKIPFKKENSPVIGLYSEYESDHNGEYTLIVGAEVNETEEDNFTFGKVVKGEYLSFNIKGDFPQAIIQGWTDIYRYFENNKEVERTFTSDFEEYLSENELNINIAIKSR